MGKRNRKSRGPASDMDGGMSRAVAKETLEIANVLLEKCSNTADSKGQDWNLYLEIYEVVEKLRKKQSAFVMRHSDRGEAFPTFMEWLKEHGVDTHAVSIEKFDVGEYGLTATKDIKESELMLTIPHKLMLTTMSAKSSLLGPLIKGDKMLQSMPSVALALHVLCERASPNSFWMPYLNILPSVYSTPLYFTSDEMLLLKGSPAFVEALNQYKNISRQYAYFFKQFQAIDDVLKLPIKNMCFDDYRWAVSTVMTRQNELPSRRGDQTMTSLIPLWDMCNHTNGYITTDYDLKKECSLCYSLRNFTKGDQIYIFYGERSNADLLVHNGFVFPDNHYDKLNIRLGISKNDHLYAMKSEVLARLSLLPSRTFGLMAGPDPVDPNMVAYLRVFSMDQATLDARLRGENSAKLIRQLRDFGLLVNVENEKKCWNFLQTRVQLLLKTYPTTLEEDNALLNEVNSKLTHHARMAIQLRASEKQILTTTAEFARLQIAEVDDLVRQHLEQISLGVGELKDSGEGNDDDDLKSLSLNPSSDWGSHQGVVIKEIDDDLEVDSNTQVTPALNGDNVNAIEALKSEPQAVNKTDVANTETGVKAEGVVPAEAEQVNKEGEKPQNGSEQVKTEHAEADVKSESQTGTEQVTTESSVKLEIVSQNGANQVATEEANENAQTVSQSVADQPSTNRGLEQDGVAKSTIPEPDVQTKKAEQPPQSDPPNVQN